jgi:hypothetical protein
MVYENAAHRLSDNREEVRSVCKLQRASASQSQVRFMKQCRRGKRMICPLGTHFGGRYTP